MADEQKIQPQRNLFSTLKRLFSTDVIIRNDGGELKTVDVDNIQVDGVLQTNALVDRFNRIYTTSTSYGVNLNLAQNYQSTRVQIYSDYESMDTDPIVASALDIIADECLGADTIIPLLDGRKLTIKELYDANEENFWLYGLDDQNKFQPVKADRVAYNGEKEVYKIEEGDLKLYTFTPEGFKPDIRCLIVPSLPAASIACNTIRILCLPSAYNLS